MEFSAGEVAPDIGDGVLGELEVVLGMGEFGTDRCGSGHLIGRFFIPVKWSSGTIHNTI